MPQEALLLDRGGLGVRLRDDDAPQGEIKSSGTVYGEVNLTYFFVEYFSLELSGGYAKPNLDLTQRSTGFAVEYGELKQIPFLSRSDFRVPKV